MALPEAMLFWDLSLLKTFELVLIDDDLAQ
jgi:hypothetical protein